MKTIKLTFFSLMLIPFFAGAQPVTDLLKKVKARLERVNDYEATGKMKTDVVFLKIPVSNIKSYYKKPNRFKLTRQNGVSLLPKGGVSVNLGSLLLTDDYSTIDAGYSTVNGKKARVVKLLPVSEQTDVVLTSLYIDEAALVILRSNTTTRENGTYEMELYYGKYTEWGLPDKVIFSFNTKDYKLPKGITLEYDDGTKAADLPKNKKGKVEITYSSYIINKGVSDALLK